MEQDRPTRDGLNLRLPRGLRDRIKAAATSNHRTMNAEVAFHLENIFGASASTAATGDRLDAKAPAAALHTTALAGGDIANPAIGVP